MPQLSVNIDHVATVRQARRTYEPDPVWAAVECQLGGAAGITMHLREDRRHIQDDDVPRVRDACHVRVNLEMAATDEMVNVARSIRPHLAMLVPEGRTEVTTEGGLGVAGQVDRLRDVLAALRDGGMLVSAFLDADPYQIDAAAEAGFDVCEVHTGPYAHAFHDPRSGDVRAELDRIADAGRRIRNAGMAFNAGHALNYLNVAPIAALDGVGELHIGHAIVSRALFVGLRLATEQMQTAMRDG